MIAFDYKFDFEEVDMLTGSGREVNSAWVSAITISICTDGCVSGLSWTHHWLCIQLKIN